jgi:hypothetical protein
MGMHDRDWYRAEKRQERGSAAPQAPFKPRRSRPVFFVHYLAGFWPGLIAGLIIGLAIGVSI